jgi:serine phosphatase RsbU (regulator of sigma subunit)
MTFCSAESLRRLTHEDVELAEQLGRRAAVAVENSRLHTELSRVAQTLQQSLLPGDLPDVPGWEIASLYRPAGAEQRIEIGGDFYEVFSTGAASFALIGDVTGHGVAAATLTALMRYGARFASRLEPQPAAILRRLDEELRIRPEGVLCTALCARLHERRLAVCSAGHPPAMIVDSEGRVSEAPQAGPLLGAFADANWEQTTIEVGADQLILLYTDGVIETAGANERFGAERLRRLLFEHPRLSPSETLARLEDALTTFSGGVTSDDVAALALRPRA